MKKKVVVVAYDPSWPQLFEQLKAVYEQSLGDLLTDIQHVGSTSVPGLAAKPIIDIDLVVENEVKKQVAIIRLRSLGYTHVGDLGITGREVFKKTHGKMPFNNTSNLWPAHNLYMCIEGAPPLLNHLYFRDYLRAHPEMAKKYGTLKTDLAMAYRENIDGYIEHKTTFIIDVLQKAGFPQAELDAIIKQNKAK